MIIKVTSLINWSFCRLDDGKLFDSLTQPAYEHSALIRTIISYSNSISISPAKFRASTLVPSLRHEVGQGGTNVRQKSLLGFSFLFVLAQLKDKTLKNTSVKYLISVCTIRIQMYSFNKRNLKYSHLFCVVQKWLILYIFQFNMAFLSYWYKNALTYSW